MYVSNQVTVIICIITFPEIMKGTVRKKSLHSELIRNDSDYYAFKTDGHE